MRCRLPLFTLLGVCILSCSYAAGDCYYGCVTAMQYIRGTDDASHDDTTCSNYEDSYSLPPLIPGYSPNVLYGYQSTQVSPTRYINVYAGRCDRLCADKTSQAAISLNQGDLVTSVYQTTCQPSGSGP